MRILILTAIPFWHPGTSELIQELRKKGIFVEALDIFHGYKVDQNDNTIDLVKLPGILRRLYLKLFRQNFVYKHIPEDAIVDIHFIEAYYSKYLLGLPNKIICTLFGSDLYRTNSEQKNLQRKLFNRAELILLSENMRAEFEKQFPEIKDKFYYNQYGSKRISLISEGIRKKPSANFNFPDDKRILCCGYNAKKEQQHFKILESLQRNEAALLNKVHLVFPLTYGNSDSYINDLKTKLNQSNFSYSLITNRLSDEEIVNLWQSVDIGINMQTTDALSSSIKEAMAARNVLLIGDWLPYQLYAEMGIDYEKINFENLPERLTNVLADFDYFYEKTEGNSRIIDEFASWAHVIDNWVSMYKKVDSNG